MNKLEEGEAGPLNVHVRTALMVVVTLSRTSWETVLTQQWFRPRNVPDGFFHITGHSYISILYFNLSMLSTAIICLLSG